MAFKGLDERTERGRERERSVLGCEVRRSKKKKEEREREKEDSIDPSFTFVIPSVFFLLAEFAMTTVQ